MKTMKRYARTASIFLAGCLLGFLSSNSQQVGAQTRPSLASLQASIVTVQGILSNIIAGTTKVGASATADNALALGGSPVGDFVKVSDPVRLTYIGIAASPANEGTLRWYPDTKKVQVSDGISWVDVN